MEEGSTLTTTYAWLDVLVPGVQVLVIVLVAWLLNRLTKRLSNKLRESHHLSPQLAQGTYRVIGAVVYITALMLVLDRLGLSGSVLWTAFTGFAAVAAVAFFAAWSVLSNIFCTVLIFITRPFRLYDYVEVLENGEKPGLKGQVIDINLIYTTMRERNDDKTDTVLQVPNNLFFQKTTRRWRGNSTPYQAKRAQSQATGGVAAPTGLGGSSSATASVDNDQTLV